MKLFTPNRNHVAAIVTLLFVIFFGAVYFFIYLPNNEKRIQEQRFRTLQHIEGNIQAKIRNSADQIKNLLRSYDQEMVGGKAGGTAGNTQVEKYIRSLPTNNFMMGSPQPAVVVRRDTVVDYIYDMRIDEAKQDIDIDVQTVFENRQYRMSMSYTFDQFIRSLLPDNVFDEYVVFSNGRVAYETFPSGLSYTRDSLLGRRNGIAAATMRNLTVGGVDYKAFLQPVKLKTDSTWVVGGLLKNARYTAEKSKLPSNIILLMTTIVLACIVMYPWLKLFQMGSKDRLTVSDGIWSTIVSMLLMSLLFFFFFKYNTVFRADDFAPKKKLAAQIAQSFGQELNGVRALIDSIDSRVVTASGALKDSRLPAKMNSVSVARVFWLDKGGNEIASWSKDSVPAPHGNFKDRDYHSKVVNKKLYQLDADSQRQFFLDQVVSWNTGKFTTVMSIPHGGNNDTVAGISFEMQSLNNPVMPRGYQFAIIDEEGRVRYHSNASRNLKENLLEECSLSDRLKGNILARTEDEFRTAYFSRDYNVYVRPMQGLPYFIVIFEDIAFKETRDLEIYSFTLSMMLLLFGFLVLQLAILFFASARRSFFKNQLFDTSWVGPVASSHHQYNLSIVFNVFTIALTIAFFHYTTFLSYVFSLLFSITFLGFFLNHLFKRKYESNNRPGKARLKRFNSIALIVFIVVIDVLAAITLDWLNKGCLLAYEVLMVAGALALFGWEENRTHPEHENTSRWHYRRSFALMSLTRLIITSGLPVAFFYISSFDFEQNINLRYRQLQYAGDLKKKKGDNVLNTIADSGFAKGYYRDGAWIRDLKPDTIAKPLSYSHEDAVTACIMRLFHVYLTDSATYEHAFYGSAAADSSFYFNSLFDDAAGKKGVSVTYVKTTTPRTQLALSGAQLNYKIPPFLGSAGVPGFLFYVLLLAALIVFYFIIYNVVNKLFCLKLHNPSLWNKLDDLVLVNDGLNRLLFMIGLPGAHKLEIIERKISAGTIHGKDEAHLVYDRHNPDAAGNNVLILDLIHIPDSKENADENDHWKKLVTAATDAKYKLVIVNHFEYNVQDPGTNRIKLNFLEKIMLLNQSKIIVLSTIHPVAFLDSVMHYGKDEADKSIPGNDLERWHVLLGHYRIILLGLEHTGGVDGDDSLRSLYKETEYTHFLSAMRKDILATAKGIPEGPGRGSNDELIFKLQITAYYFYMYIWQSLTNEEKFLLYDLAEDNLVNSYDSYNLNMLLAKGVIIRPDGGMLKIFNKGFRNFILTAIGNAEAMKIKNYIRDSGNWNKLRVPLLIIIVAILTFLFASQQEAYTKLITYVAALSAGVPTVMKLLSTFGKGGEKGGDGKT